MIPVGECHSEGWKVVCRYTGLMYLAPITAQRCWLRGHAKECEAPDGQVYVVGPTAVATVRCWDTEIGFDCNKPEPVITPLPVVEVKPAPAPLDLSSFVQAPTDPMSQTATAMPPARLGAELAAAYGEAIRQACATRPFETFVISVEQFFTGGPMPWCFDRLLRG